MRITRKSLEGLTAVLNRRLNRPQAAWTVLQPANNPKHQSPLANVGHIHVTSYSPGDGWTRYQVCEILNPQGGISTISPVGTAQEIFQYLRGVLDCLDKRYEAVQS